MNIYESIKLHIETNQKKDNCPVIVSINPKKYEEFRTKSFEEIQETAKKYGLYLMINNYDIFGETHKYDFSLEPLNPKNGLPISVTVD